MAQLTAELWDGMWKTGYIPWHEGQVNTMLQKHIHEMTSGQKNLRIFVPMCGKSLDLVWLADQGHAVVGVEGSEIAVKSFFEENQLQFTTEAINLVSVEANSYKARSKAITILQCDLFCVSSELLGGKFDAIWDRGALIAVDEELRAKYVEVVANLLSPAGCWLVETYDFNPADNPDPGPFIVTEEDMNAIFGEKFDIRVLEKSEVSSAPSMPFKHVAQLFQLKKRI